jgi:hypothetical protein
MGTSVPKVRWRNTLIRSIFCYSLGMQRPWIAARSTLALDLVRFVQGRAALLTQVQRRILIPIESVLIEQNDVTLRNSWSLRKQLCDPLVNDEEGEGLTFAQLRGEVLSCGQTGVGVGS